MHIIIFITIMHFRRGTKKKKIRPDGGGPEAISSPIIRLIYD